MKKIIIASYISLPFFICSLFVVLTKYTTMRSTMFDFSELIVLGSFVFWGIILFVTNLLIYERLKNKKILNNIWIHQASNIVTYILLCVASNLLIEPAYSYNLVFLMPFILIAISIFLNVIISIIKKTINHEGVFDKVSMMACILLLCLSVTSITYYYVEWDSSKEWAQMNEGIVIWDYVRRIEGNIDRFYKINAVKESDEVYSVNLEEIYYYNSEEEGIKIAQQLRGRNVGKVTKTQYIKKGYKHSYAFECSLGGWLEPKLTEESFNRFIPLTKDITVNNKISYSKLLNLLCDNGFSRS